MKRLTLRLLALVMALAMLGGFAAVAEPVIIEDAPDDAFALPGAELDIDLPAIGDFELAQNDVASEDAVTENDVPAAPNATVKSGSCGPNVKWTLDDSGLLTISGSGDMDNYFAFWEVNGGVGIKRAVVEEGVTSLALNTFNGCEWLESVSLPDSLENILASAFSDCRSLTRVDIPYGVPWISGYCFAGCYSLTRVTVPESVTEVVDHAFDNCPRLTLYGYDGSTIETYANENGIPFVSLGAAPARPSKPKHSVMDSKITVKDQVYTGKALKPAVKVVLNGKTLTRGRDYTVSYSYNTNIGTALVEVTGIGDYTGTAMTGFKINPKAVTGLKLTAGKGKMTASWKKVPGGVGGYQLQYGLKKNFSGAKKVTVSKAATVRRVLKNLKKGKIYYVRIRAWKKDSGKTYWSAWSGAKKVRVK